MNNRNEPFQGRLATRYWEYYARVVLEELFPEEFSNMEIKEKPDLQRNDGQLGVEVTIVRDKKQLEAESLYTTVCYNMARDKVGALANIKKWMLMQTKVF